jgi:hypothetical protein
LGRAEELILNGGRESRGVAGGAVRCGMAGNHLSIVAEGLRGAEGGPEESERGHESATSLSRASGLDATGQIHVLAVLRPNAKADRSTLRDCTWVNQPSVGLNSP